MLTCGDNAYMWRYLLHNVSFYLYMGFFFFSASLKNMHNNQLIDPVVPTMDIKVK